MHHLLFTIASILNLLHTGEPDLELKSAAFEFNASIPIQYTCDGTNISPPLAWSGIPKAAKSLALIVDDPDAPSRTVVHWVVYNIPPTVTQSTEGNAPEGALQGINDHQTIGYTGPCPPNGTHRYFFKLYALDTALSLSQGSTKSEVEDAMTGHILAETNLVATYGRR